MWLEVLFSPKRYQFYHDNTLSPVIFFRRNTLKGPAKASPVDLLKLNTLRDTDTAFLTPERYHEHPRPF